MKDWKERICGVAMHGRRFDHDHDCPGSGLKPIGGDAEYQRKGKASELRACKCGAAKDNQVLDDMAAALAGGGLPE